MRDSLPWRAALILFFIAAVSTGYTPAWHGPGDTQTKFSLSGRFIGEFGLLKRTAGKPKRIEQRGSTESGNPKLPACGYFLPFTGHSASLSSARSQFLSLQIGSLVLVGFLFAIPSVLGLAWVFDDPNRNRKLAGAILALVCLTGTLTFYGWGRFGHPGAFWGLCAPFTDGSNQSEDQPSATSTTAR